MNIAQEIIKKWDDEKKIPKDVSYYKKLLAKQNQETLEKISKVVNIINEEINIFNDIGAYEPPYHLTLDKKKIVDNGILISDFLKIVELLKSDFYMVLPKNNDYFNKKEMKEIEEELFIILPIEDWNVVLQKSCFEYPYEENFKNFTEALKEIKEEKINKKENGKRGKKFPHKLPRGTIWENIIIQFIDEENISISVKGFKHQTNYKEILLVGKGKNPKPSEVWNFLKLLAINNGEVSWRHTKNLPLKTKNTIKKHKESLSEFLQSYFEINLDPFFPYQSYPPYKHEKSYKIRVKLIPTQKMIDKTKKINNEKKEKNDLGIEEEYKKLTPELYDNY